MIYRVGDVVEVDSYGPLILFRIESFMPPPSWKEDRVFQRGMRDVQVRVTWKVRPDFFSSWAEGDAVCVCESYLREPEVEMLAIALAVA